MTAWRVDREPSVGRGSLLLVHGAAGGPWTYDGWAEDFPEYTVVAVDLQRRVLAERASMEDYADEVKEAAAGRPRPLALVGWSMGGLVGLMAAERVRPEALVLIESSPPAEVTGFHPEVEPREGSYAGEEMYGKFPGLRSRRESWRAYTQRKRGISVPSLPCRSLVLYGDQFGETRGPAIARLYGSRAVHFPGFDHWDVVSRPEVRAAIRHFLMAEN